MIAHVSSRVLRLNEKRIEIDKEMVFTVLFGKASMKRGLKLQPERQFQRISLGEPQWKEDWNKTLPWAFLLSPALCLNEKRIEMRWEDRRCYIAKQARLNEKRIEMSQSAQLIPELCDLSLNEKRIEINKSFPLLEQLLLLPQWKEDWNLCIWSPPTSAICTASMKRGLKWGDRGLAGTGGNFRLNEKRIEI